MVEVDGVERRLGPVALGQPAALEHRAQCKSRPRDSPRSGARALRRAGGPGALGHHRHRPRRRRSSPGRSPRSIPTGTSWRAAATRSARTCSPSTRSTSARAGFPRCESGREARATPPSPGRWPTASARPARGPRPSCALLSAADVAGVLGQDPRPRPDGALRRGPARPRALPRRPRAGRRGGRRRRVGRRAGRGARSRHALLRRPRLLQARADHAERPRAGRRGRVRRPRRAHDLRRQPRPARAAAWTECCATRPSWPPTSTPASCCRPASRSRRSAPAPCTPAS